MKARSAVIFAATLLLLAVACWTVIPAPTNATLLLAIGVPELAAFGLPVAMAFVVAAALVHGRLRIPTLMLAIAASACLGWPLVAAVGTEQQARRALDAAGFAPLHAARTVAVDERRDLPVRLRDGSSLALDLYRPRVTPDVPLVVLIYGGAWRVGRRADEAPLARWYASRGFAVAAIDYRHAPAYRFPTQRDDVEDALRTIAAQARAWRIDPHRVALFGRSAGAQLALLAAERPAPLHVAAVVAYYSPVDLVRGWNEPPRPDPADVRGILEAYLGGPPDAVHAAAYHEASPLDQAHASMPAVLLIGGDRDELVRVEFQRTFAARLHALGDRVIAIELPWSNHSFDAVQGLGASIARDSALRFLNETLSP